MRPRRAQIARLKTGLGDDLHHAGVVIEDRPFGGLDRAAGEHRQGHCRLFEVLRARPCERFLRRGHASYGDSALNIPPDWAH